jgi:hypothetical protein
VARVRALVMRALLAVVVTTSLAAADVVDLPDTPASVTLDAAWTPVTAARLVAAYRTRDGVLLAITRAQLPNAAAWRDKTRAAYADEIERGLVAAGYRRTAREVGKLAGVPALTLDAKRKDGATVLVRILLFRTYALALALEVPRGVDGARARAVRASFAPAS